MPIAKLVLLARVVDALVVEGLESFALVVSVCREEAGAGLVLDVGLLVPDLLDVVVDVGRPVAARSVDGELHVETHVRLATVITRQILERQVKRRRLEAAVIRLAIIETKHALDFLGSGDSLGNAIDL